MDQKGRRPPGSPPPPGRASPSPPRCSRWRIRSSRFFPRMSRGRSSWERRPANRPANCSGTISSSRIWVTRGQFPYLFRKFLLESGSQHRRNLGAPNLLTLCRGNVAPHVMPSGALEHVRMLGAATIVVDAISERAPDVEDAARRNFDERRRPTGCRREPGLSVPVHSRRGAEQSPGVGHFRRIKNSSTGPSSTHCPPYMTRAVSQDSAPTPRSCMIEITAECSSSISSRI